MLTYALARAANIDAGERSWTEDNPDAGLVAAAQADPRAFSCLYERYRTPINRYCYNRLRRRKAAEDAAADVFVEAFANLLRYPGGPFASWLYTIAAQVVARYGGRTAASDPCAETGSFNTPLPTGEIAPAGPARYWA